MKESKKAYMKAWSLKNKERRAAYMKKYAEDNAERIAKNRKVNRKKNMTCLLEQRNAWVEKNKEAIREYNRIYTNKRYYEDFIFRLKMVERNRIRVGLKNNRKSSKTELLIGCSFEFLRMHIENQFTEGMNWGNIGEWQIDHIRPLSSFDLSDPKQQIQAFHYSNQQPLWKKDNLKKGAKVLEQYCAGF